MIAMTSLFKGISHVLVLLLVTIITMAGGVLKIIFDICIHRKKYFENPKPQVEPLPSDPSLGIHKTAHLENIDLHYVESGPPDGPLMLLVHGFPEFWFSWRHQIHEFQRDYRVVAVDVRGQGYSGKPSGVACYTMDCYVEDFRQLLDHLGVERCTLVGHDMGGVMCWCFATAHPECVERLVQMNAPHPGAFQRILRASLRQKIKSWYVIFFQLPFLPEWFLSRLNHRQLVEIMTGPRMGLRKRKLSPKEKDMYQMMYCSPGYLTSSLNFYRASFRYRRTTPEGKVRPRTLVIWGTEDNALSLPIANAIRDFCEDVRIEYLDGVSHFVQQDAPESVNDLLRQFLD